MVANHQTVLIPTKFVPVDVGIADLVQFMNAVLQIDTSHACEGEVDGMPTFVLFDVNFPGAVEHLKGMLEVLPKSISEALATVVVWNLKALKSSKSST